MSCTPGNHAGFPTTTIDGYDICDACGEVYDHEISPKRVLSTSDTLGVNNTNQQSEEQLDSEDETDINPESPPQERWSSTRPF